MKVWIQKAIAFTMAMGLGGCGAPQNADENLPNGRPRVVVTSTILADLTAEVGGENIQLTSILRPGDDPHVYEPVPQDSAAIAQADLIFYNGHNLEPALIKMINGVGNQARKVALGEGVEPLAFQNDNQTEPDPHVWGDVENVVIMVAAIAQELGALAPADRALFEDNSEALQDELQALDQWITAQIATIPPENRQLISTHDAFQYYAQAYGLTVTGTLIGMSTEEQPSAQTVKNLAEAIKNKNIPAVFAETTLNPALLAAVAEESGVTIWPTELYSDSLGQPQSPGGSYVQMMVSNTLAIAEGLGGTPTPFNFPAE